MTKNNKVQLTKEGLEALKKELVDLVEDKRPALVKRVARARDFGDLSENSEYANARQELLMVDQRIDELKEVIKKVAVVKKSKNNGNGAVKIGSQVAVKANGSQQSYTLVGELEADPTQMKISVSSPIGKALLGKKKGDEVRVETPGGQAVYLIEKIA